MIGNKITDKITKVSRTLPQDNSETVKNDHNNEITNIHIYIYIYIYIYIQNWWFNICIIV